MRTSFKKFGKKIRIFSISPLVVAMALALDTYPLEVQALPYKYLGRWAANESDSSAPLLKGTLIGKDTSEFTYSEPNPGDILLPRGFKKGEDMSYLWAGSSFEEVYKNNKDEFDLYGLTATNPFGPNSLYLDAPLLGDNRSTTIVDVSKDFEGKEQNNSLRIILPVEVDLSGRSLVAHSGTYTFNTNLVSINYISEINTPKTTKALFSLKEAGTQKVVLPQLAWNGVVFEKFITDKETRWQPDLNVLFMLLSIPNSTVKQTLSAENEEILKVGEISTPDDEVLGGMSLFKKDGWHIDQLTLSKATLSRPIHNTHGISMYGGGNMALANSTQIFTGEIQSLGTQLRPLGIGIISALDQASGTIGNLTSYRTFIQRVGKVNEIHAVMAGVVNDVKARNFFANQEQTIEVGKIEVFGDGAFRGAIGIYNRNNTGSSDSTKVSQKILISDSIVVDGYSTKYSPHNYLEIVPFFAAVANRGGSQVIESTNREKPILLSAKTQMKASSATDSSYGAYSVLVFPNYVKTGNPATGYTETTLRGSFDVYNGDIAAFGEQSKTFGVPYVGIRLEGLQFPAENGKPETIANRLSLFDGNNIIVTDRSPLVPNSKPSTSIKGTKTDKAYLRLIPITDSNGFEHPYEIEFKGKNSYLLVEGAYQGHGTIRFHSTLDFQGPDKWTSREEFLKENGTILFTKFNEDLLKKWKTATEEERKELSSLGDFKKDSLGNDYVVLNDKGTNSYSIAVEKAYKELFDKGNNIVVNKNPVLIHKVVKQDEKTGLASRLNLLIDTSNLREQLNAVYPGEAFASEKPEIKKFFDENAIYILRQAANNVFVHEWEDQTVLLPHDRVLSQKTGEKEDGSQIQITDEHSNFLEKIKPEKKTLESKTEKKTYTLGDGTLVETTITTEKVGSTNNRFTGHHVNNQVAGQVSFTIPEGIITPQRTYVTEYYIENKANYDANNPYGYNDNKILHQFLSEYDRDKYGKELNSQLDVDVGNLAPQEPLKSAEQLRQEKEESSGVNTRAVTDSENKEGKPVEEVGIENMGEVY